MVGGGGGGEGRPIHRVTTFASRPPGLIKNDLRHSHGGKVCDLLPAFFIDSFGNSVVINNNKDNGQFVPINNCK